MTSPASTATSSEPSRWKLSWVSVAVIGFTVGILVNLFFVDNYVVPSASMENTLQRGDYMLSAPLLDNATAPERGEVVVFNPPASWGQPEGTVFVKRVIAVGGDTVECCDENGDVLVNGEPIEEPYLKNGAEDLDLEYSYEVPEGSVFVLGDNRLMSADSRYHEDSPFVSVDDVIGQPKVLYWPLNRFTWL